MLCANSAGISHAFMKMQSSLQLWAARAVFAVAETGKSPASYAKLGSGNRANTMQIIS